MIQGRSKGIMLSYLNTLVSMICGLFLSSFLLRMLGNTEYGVYQTVASFANYLVLFEFGTGTVMTRNLSLCLAENADKEKIDRNISSIWAITNILAIVIIAASGVFYLSLGSVYRNSMTLQQIETGKTILLFVSANLVFTFYNQTLNGVLMAYRHYSFSSSMSLLRTISRTILLAALITAWRKALIIAIVDMSLSLIISLVSFYVVKKECAFRFSPKKIDVSILKSSFPLCMAIFIQTIVNQANSNVDKFVIGILINPESVALYSVALYIYSVFSSITTIPISMYAPQIISDVASGKKGIKLTQTLVAPSRLITLIGGAVLFGFIGVGRQFVEIVYGTEYIEAWYIAIIIMTPMFINMTVGVAINVLDAMNKRMMRSWILLGTTISNIVLTIIWIDKYGMIGAAAATAVCTFIGQITLMNIFYAKNIGLDILLLFKESYHGILIYQILGAFFAYLIGSAIHNTVISFLVGAIIFITIMIGGYLYNGTTKSEKERIYSVIAKFKK